MLNGFLPGPRFGEFYRPYATLARCKTCGKEGPAGCGHRDPNGDICATRYVPYQVLSYVIKSIRTGRWRFVDAVEVEKNHG